MSILSITINIVLILFPLSAVYSIEYLVVGVYKGCTDYDGYEEITTVSECQTAAEALELDCQTLAEIPDTIYPRNCYYNLASSGCGTFISKLYFNAGSSGYTYGNNNRYPICKKTVGTPSDWICSVGLGRVQGGATTPPDDISSLLTCTDTFTFTPYNRDGYMHFALNIKEIGYDWGFQKWKLDVYTADSYETLWSYADYAPLSDAVEGIAIDNSRDIGYTFLTHKWSGTYSNAWERRIMQIDLETGNATIILVDYFPYNCHRLDVSNNFRAVMDIDETNNILYWMGMSQDDELSLYSLDLNASPLQVQIEFIFASNPYGGEQQSQLHVDCNGNIWFTGLLSGVYFYVPGWSEPKLIIDEGNAGMWGGVTTIRRDNSMEMDVIVAKYFDVRSYDAAGLLTNTYTTYPSPPYQIRVGSDGDIMHVLKYDYQNKKMAINTRSNDGDYITFVYDPIPPANPNLVWNYVKGPAEREGMGIRFGNYTYYEPPPNATLLCDNMTLESLKYTWIGGRYVDADSTHCSDGTFDTSPCVLIKGYDESMQRRIDTSGLINVEIRFNIYIDAFSLDATEGVYFGYSCDGSGTFTENLKWLGITGAMPLEASEDYETYHLNDTTCWNNNAVIIRFRWDSNSNTDSAYIDNMCVYGEATVTSPEWPDDPLPYCDDLTNYKNGTYWTDYADLDLSASAAVEVATSSYCVGTSTCARLKYFGRLYLNDFSTKNLYDLYIKYNLCLGCDPYEKILSSETFEVLYSCDGSYDFVSLKTYNGSLVTAKWDGKEFPDESVDLPAECNNIDNLRISFKLDAYGNDVYLDSFCIKSKTPIPTVSPTKNPSVYPTASPSSDPTKSPTKNPSSNPTLNPSINPSETPTESPEISGSPTTAPTISTVYPSASPSENPTKYPTYVPSAAPTDNPSPSPTYAPTRPGDTRPPSSNPIIEPTYVPTAAPTDNPSTSPTYAPTRPGDTRRPSSSPIGNTALTAVTGSTATVVAESTEGTESEETETSEVGIFDGCKTYNVIVVLLTVVLFYIFN